ncbi:ABC transporter ATP-binding protein [Candidatus Dependentiae bacterium]|nr:ABC transporter ATP-binding protein [Candidatus Dependentiae bacterium]MBU4386874.1 ABC transporter ATP-binding protein [Candidatus Dependentiae bacterium]MCG2756483.1 ABC transporter ATP-binding protein [Candidatus Dependentiae bacterium]
MSNKLLQIKNIKKIYKQKGQKPISALKGVTLDIYNNEVITLLGVNGAGKSTLSSIIATLHPATEGDIIFEGKSIYDNLVNYRSMVGFCPQKPNLDDFLTLEQNLIFSGRLYGLSESEINIRLKKLTDQFGLKEYLPRKSDVLSGGYKQRFTIARCLMHSPKIVLLDEPTVGLDPHIRREIWAIIRELKQEGVTVILTTHYLDEAEFLSDRVCILDNGLIKLIDTPEKLVSDFKKKNLEDVFLALMQENKE